ncbi:group-specific protein [Bacillus cereus E33L]|uniref:Group-specific protein n=2 Tax=Bacillus cereus TaxID=1396 RepID=Q632R9_BACCZ|nr:group-specific protein [Bacillus cereus E33L]
MYHHFSLKIYTENYEQYTMYVVKEVVSLMLKLLRYPIFLGLLGSFFISSGMALQHILPYSPSVGWILGFICFLTASYFAVKNKNI